MILLLFSQSLFISCTEDEAQSELVVYAAASLSDVMTEIGNRYEDSTGTEILYNFAGSNVLARQIVAAEGADLFLSANEEWMDYVSINDRLVEESRIRLLSNSLVVVANRTDAFRMEEPQDICTLDATFLVLGNPDAVPAGRYAREWLQTIQCRNGSAWERWSPQVSPAPDVRAALGMVEAAASTIGVVYRTDAAMSERVKVIYQVSSDTGPVIHYPAARVNNAPNPEEASRFFEYLRSPEAADIFREYGFITLASAS